MGEFARTLPWVHMGIIMEPGWLGRPMEAECPPERAVDPDCEDFCRPEQEQALLSIPATPKKKKIVPSETIAAAVSECVDKKITVSVLAEKYRVDPSTIRNWVKRAGKTLPSRQQATPKKPGNPSILNYFSPTKNPTRQLSLAPPDEARDNAMDLSDFLKVKVEEEDEIEIVEEMKTTTFEADSDYIKAKQEEFRGGDVKRKLVPGRRRNTKHKTTMLFMESGTRQSPWYTWQVTAGKDNSGKYDMQKKAKRGGRTEGATFEMRSFRRRTRPAKCLWSATCCLCGGNEVNPTRLNIKRKSVYLLDDDEARRNKLGRMSTMVWNSKTVTAHYYCLFYAADKDMIQSPLGDNIDTQLEGFPIKAVLNQEEKSRTDSCVFCNKPGASSQCANLKCIKTGWYHFPCGLKNGCVQKKGKTWCGRCSGGLSHCQLASGRRPSVNRNGSKQGGRGRQKRQILPLIESSQSSQELFSKLTQEARSYTGATSSGLANGVRDLSQNGASKGYLNSLLQPISAQQILAEIDRREEERSKVLKDPLRCVSIAQVHHIPKEEFMAEDGTPVKVETKEPLERYSIFHKLPVDEETNDPQASSSNYVPEQVVLYEGYEDKAPLPSSLNDQLARPESRSLLEDDDLETEPFESDNPESPGGMQSGPKISLKTASDSIIVIEDEVETGLQQYRDENSSQMGNMRRQLELTDGLLKAKRAELEQLEMKHNEEVNFFEKKLQMKDCEMALLKERNNADMTKKEEEWKGERKGEEEKWNDQISKLQSELEKAKKEKDEAKKEKDEAKKAKDEALRKLSAIYQLASPQELKREGEYVEGFTSQDIKSSTGVKREAEEEESDGGAEKRSRFSCWNL